MFPVLPTSSCLSFSPETPVSEYFWDFWAFLQMANYGVINPPSFTPRGMHLATPARLGGRKSGLRRNPGMGARCAKTQYVKLVYRNAPTLKKGLRSPDPGPVVGPVRKVGAAKGVHLAAPPQYGSCTQQKKINTASTLDGTISWRLDLSAFLHFLCAHYTPYTQR